MLKGSDSVTATFAERPNDDVDFQEISLNAAYARSVWLKRRTGY
jgi:hypothetical protein